MMTQKRTRLSDQIRKAIEESGLTHYRICKLAGIDQATFSRFMRGIVGLSLATLDDLADVLGLDIVAHGPTEATKQSKTGKKPTRKGR